MVENRPLYPMYRAAAQLGKNVGLGDAGGGDTDHLACLSVRLNFTAKKSFFV